MTKEDQIKKRIKAMSDQDKNGLILSLYHILYFEDGEFEPDLCWDGETVNRIGDTLNAYTGFAP